MLLAVWSPQIEANNIASKHVVKTKFNVQTWYNKRVYGEDIKTREIVLLKNVSVRGGAGKFKLFWEETVCKILNKKPDIPVYEIVPENGHCNTKTVHKNLLLTNRIYHHHEHNT